MSSSASSGTASAGASAAHDKGKAALDVYLRYRRVVETTGSNPGGHKDLLSALATGEELDRALNVDEVYAARGWRLVGSSDVVTSQVVSVRLPEDPNPVPAPEVIVAVCLDISRLHYVNRSGQIVPEASGDGGSFARDSGTLTYVSRPGHPGAWLVSKTDITSTDGC